MLLFEKRPKLRLIFIPIQILSFIAAWLEGTDLPIWMLALILLLEGWLIYLTLYFDNDTEMELVRQCIGISEATIVNRCDRRKNPFDESKNLPGFW